MLTLDRESSFLIEIFYIFLSYFQTSDNCADPTGGLWWIQYSTSLNAQIGQFEWTARLGATRSDTLPVH